jgi:hypothetical protein
MLCTHNNHKSRRNKPSTILKQPSTGLDLERCSILLSYLAMQLNLACEVLQLRYR